MRGRFPLRVRVKLRPGSQRKCWGRLLVPAAPRGLRSAFVQLPSSDGSVLELPASLLRGDVKHHCLSHRHGHAPFCRTSGKGRSGALTDW